MLTARIMKEMVDKNPDIPIKKYLPVRVFNFLLWMSNCRMCVALSARRMAARVIRGGAIESCVES